MLRRKKSWRKLLICGAACGDYPWRIKTRTSLLYSKNLLPSLPFFGGGEGGRNWDFQRLDRAAGLKVSGATNNLSFWQMRLDGRHLSPADHAGTDICRPRREMRSLVAFRMPALTATLIALDLSTFTHLSNAPDWAWTHTLLFSPPGPFRAL